MKDSTMMAIIGSCVALGIGGFITMMIYFTINPNKAYELSAIFLTMIALACGIILVHFLGKQPVKVEGK